MSVRHDITEKTLSEGTYRVLHAGDDYEYQFTIKRVGVPIDLTAGKIWFTIKARDTEEDVQAKLQLTSDDTAEIEVTDAAGGVFLVKFSGEGSKSTANLAGEWSYDMQIKTAALGIVTIARGIIEFLPNLTRSTT